ncbi:antitoxin [Pelagerythrobacter marensis]|uniref:Antitoxin n=1 Tax=Pelagerythrobacter marensis TaxID=543877 RepID=A0ABZ2D6J1_9SPHN
MNKKTIKQHETDRLGCDAAAEDTAWQELKVVLEHRITEGVADGTSAKNVDAIVDEELSKDSPA